MRKIVTLTFAVLTFAATPASAVASGDDEQLARCANENHQYSPDQQIAGCTALIQEDPKNEAAYFNRGLVHGRDLQQYDRAVADFDQAIRLNPQDAAAYHSRAMSYERLGQKDRAEADFEQAAKLDPDDYGN